MKTETKNSRLIIFVLVMVAIIVMMTIVIRGSSTSGKYDTFAKALVKEGVAFYGAFWCPHCQEQEKWFEASRQKLTAEGLYKECEHADRSRFPICDENKIESYPTWTFPKGISITSAKAPEICSIAPNVPGEDPRCTTNWASEYFRRWVFPSGEIVASDVPPTHTGDVWTFLPSAQLRGEATLQRLSEISGVPLVEDTQK